jgi:glycosyltransferase involved in cell wall biosynthesis
VEFSPSGGLFQFAVQLGTALACSGNDVHLLTGPSPELVSRNPRFVIEPVLPTWHPRDGAAGSGARVRKLRRAVRACRLLLAWLLLVRRLIQLYPDVVMWSTWRFTLDAAFVTLLGRTLPRTTSVLVAHEPTAHSARDTTVRKSGRLFDQMLALAWRSMDVIFVLGEETRRRAIEAWHPPAPVLVIPHGDSGALVKEAASCPGAASTDAVVLFFGTWSRYKGLELLLDAFALLRSRMPDARLVIAGGVGRDLNLSSVLRRAEAIGGVDARPRYIDAAELNTLFATARVVVTPYLRASQSGVAHLAHTFARPVVATSVGDIPSVVHHRETGLVVPPADADALASALEEMMRDPELAERLGTAGRQRLAKEATWSHVATRVDAGIALVRGRERPDPVSSGESGCDGARSPATQDR